jgi:hypothetical protein
MYLTDLHIENVRIIPSLELNFMRGDKPRMWTTLLAENGCGKSTVLQAIALAASGATLGTALIGNAQTLVPADSGEDGRAQWQARFVGGEAAEPPLYETAMMVDPGVYELMVKAIPRTGRKAYAAREPIQELTTFQASHPTLRDLRAKRLPGFFVVGYGVGRFLPQPGEKALPINPQHDRLEGLFSKHHKVLGTDFYAALSEDSPKAALAFTQELKEALLATGEDGERLFPFLDDVEIRGKNGVKALKTLLQARRFKVTAGKRTMKLPATSLSDGYQSMLAWIADLLGQAYLEWKKVRPAREISGIALIDELDLHLHPTWQRNVAPILKRLFPKVQFIVTTHSPLVVASLEQDEIVRLELGPEGARLAPAGQAPGLLNTTEVLTSYFGVPYAGPSDLRKKMDEYLDLMATSQLDFQQARRLKTLKKELAPHLNGNGH